MFLVYQSIWPVILTQLLGMKMIYWDCFFRMRGILKECWSVSNCRVDGNMFLSACRKNYYSQGVSYRLYNFKCLYSSWCEILLELRKEGEWLGHVQCDSVTWGMFTGLSGIFNCNGQWTAILAAFMYTVLHTQWHTVLHTQWHSHCCHRSLNSLSHTLLHCHYSNTVNVSTVVM